MAKDGGWKNIKDYKPLPTGKSEPAPRVGSEEWEAAQSGGKKSKGKEVAKTEDFSAMYPPGKRQGIPDFRAPKKVINYGSRGSSTAISGPVSDDEWHRSTRKDTASYRSTPYDAPERYKRCHESHPAMPIPGTEWVIYGGSCSDPKVKDADVYIGFDPSMTMTERRWPWTVGNEVYMHVRDMDAPKNPCLFDELLLWTADQIRQGRKVHVGCIGGHGRTGTFLAALICLCFDHKDAIAYVRQHYCHKAVESRDQINFLVKRYGAKTAEPAKTYTTSHRER